MLVSHNRSGHAVDDGLTPMSNLAMSRSFEAGDIALIRRLVSDHLALTGLNSSRRQDLILAIDEIATNAVRHGGGRGLLELWLTAGRLCFRITDQGPGMGSDSAAATPAMAPAPTQLGGRGLWIARQVVDEITITTGADGTAVTGAMIMRE
jgi:anti-sigma regulatory factor (Ser/Thr protein kinase)